MSEQLIFNFPFKKNYLSQDFYVSKNNFNAFKLIESWPKWPSRFVNIFGPKGCGKTHLINILNSKIQCIIVSAVKVDVKVLNQYKIKECLAIDNFEKRRGEAETLGGFLTEITQRLPRIREKILFEEIQFTIESVDKKRIKRVKVKLS